jgi:hypothetical protein
LDSNIGGDARSTSVLFAEESLMSSAQAIGGILLPVRDLRKDRVVE